MKILVIEDEPKLTSFLKNGLEENGHEVSVAFDGYLGVSRAMSNDYDAILMDVNLPVMNGFEATRKIRSEGNDTPVLMLTAMGSIDDKVIGYESGADDYLTKPFEFQELLLKLNVFSKRKTGNGGTGRMLKVADLELDLDQKRALRGGKKIELTSKEFHLLDYLIRNRNRVLSRAELAEKVWDIHFDTGTNTIDVYINFLRKKIDKDFSKKLIHTAVGMGYILKEE